MNGVSSHCRGVIGVQPDLPPLSPHTWRPCTKMEDTLVRLTPGEPQDSVGTDSPINSVTAPPSHCHRQGHLPLGIRTSKGKEGSSKDLGARGAS